MAGELKEGERVSVTAACRVAGFDAGDCGRIVWVSRRGGPTSEVAFYHVQMDRTGASRLVAFYPDEVEAEVAPAG
jgi:hypothetical protein